MGCQYFFPIYAIRKVLYDVKKLIFVEERGKEWHQVLQLKFFENIQIEMWE